MAKNKKAGAITLVIVGRPNVGKSTLFNRLVGQRRSIVGDEPGITRDRIYGKRVWGGHNLRVIDTGGIIPEDKQLIPAEIFRQAKLALDEADAVVMVVDGRSEITAPDLELARLMIRSGTPLLLAVNKVDVESMRLAAQVEEFRRLGIKEMVPISAEHGRGIEELVQHVIAAVPKERRENAAVKEDDETDAEPSWDEIPLDEKPEAARLGETPSGEQRHGEYVPQETRVAIIGRPNVGKSTLLNRLTGTSRAIVSPIAGTTRDAVDEVVERDGQKFRFIDTAGIRRKGKTHLMAEKMSVVMARKHLEAADVALLVIDATEGVTAADATIGGYAHESGRSVIVVVNKWDLMGAARTDGKPAADRAIFEEQLRHVLKFLDYAPVQFISAESGKNAEKIFKLLEKVSAERRKRVTTGQMNRFIKNVDFERASVPAKRRVRIFYMTQTGVAPPTFVLFTDKDVDLHFSYERFLQNQIREAFGFEGSPIWIKNRPRKKVVLEKK